MAEQTGGSRIPKSTIWIADIHYSTSQPPELPHGMVLELYTQGCRRHCPHCHNKELWGFGEGFQISAFEVADRFKREPLASAVALTGGEPMDQEFIISFIQDLRAAMNFGGDNRPIILYTNGLKPNKMNYVIDHIGFVIFGGPLDSERTPSDGMMLAASVHHCRMLGVPFIHWRKEDGD